MGRRRCLWLVTVIYLCFLYVFITHRQGNNEHGERKRRSFMMPHAHSEETEELRKHLRRNATDFLLSIEEINWAYTIANDSFIILIPANFSTPIITGFLTADTNVIWDLVTEDIILDRDVVTGYNYTTLIDELVGNETDVGPMLTMDNVPYLVALSGMVGNTSILIAFEISPDSNYYNPEPIANHSTGPEFPYGDISMNATFEGGIEFYNYSDYPAADFNFSSYNFTDNYNSTYDDGNSSEKSGYGGGGAFSANAGAFAYSWNAFSGYKHFNKPITVSTFSPPKRTSRKNKDKKGMGMSQSQNQINQGQVQFSGFQNLGSLSTPTPPTKKNKKVTQDRKKTESGKLGSPSTSNAGKNPKSSSSSSSSSSGRRSAGRGGKG